MPRRNGPGAGAGAQAQLTGLQQQHAALAAAAAASAASKQPPPVHNTAWTTQIHPENGQPYYFNSSTGESTYVRPADFNPSAATASAAGGSKGPPGANLFLQRKMRRGEYDQFNDDDLRREFGQFGHVTRAEMTIDRENGWSKGFGFVSYATVEEADAAIRGLNGTVVAGKLMKVERTTHE